MINAIHDLFTNEVIRKVLFKTRWLVAVALLFPLARYMRLEWLIPAIAISVFGQLIQTWCFASLVKNRELTQRGPYVFSRNPMYLGRFFLMLGFVLLLGNPWVIVAFAVIYYLYMVNRVKREEKRLARIFGDDYAQYCRDVNRFFPTLGRLGDRRILFFNWAMFHENNAHWNIVLTVAAYAVLYAVRVAVFPDVP